MKYHKIKLRGQVSFYVESRLIISVVPGRRILACGESVVQAVKDKTRGRTDLLLTSDEHSSYEAAIAKVYKIPERELTDKTSAEDSTEPEDKLPPNLCDATVW
ncbi:MAG: hypothetical protein GXP14_04130 [Gammaproteobacteria bacterium]|nr:hypothetical protein [Gammaproteobacteria bacterium]